MESKRSRKTTKPEGVLVSAAHSIERIDEVVNRLFDEVSPLITAARGRAAVVVNAELTNLNWDVGSRINREILGNGRAEYGKRVVKGLAHRLMLSHGSGWDEKTLRHCLRVAETFDKAEIAEHPSEIYHDIAVGIHARIRQLERNER